MSDKLRIDKLAQWAYTIKDLVQWVRGLIFQLYRDGQFIGGGNIMLYRVHLA